MGRTTGRPRGRPSRDRTMAGVRATIDAAAEVGASYLLDVISGRIKKPSYAKIEVAKFAIEHKVGKPKTQVVLPTDSQGRTIIPHSQLIILATEGNGHGEIPAQIKPPEGEVIEGEVATPDV
jgi:hypothetical protein